jgi:hypothetical protein
MPLRSSAVPDGELERVPMSPIAVARCQTAQEMSGGSSGSPRPASWSHAAEHHPHRIAMPSRRVATRTGPEFARPCVTPTRRVARTCRISPVWVGQPGWRPVMAVRGWTLSPRGCRRGAVRRAAGTRSAMRRTRSAASARGIPAAVTNNGRPGDPRTTGTAWVTVRNRDLATTPITGMPNSACGCARAGSAAGGPGRRNRRPPEGPAL